MDITQHCNICDHQIVDFATGTICGISKRKPSFNKSCLNIDLNSNFQEKFKTALIEYHFALRGKTTAYLYMITFIIIGLGVVLLGYFIGKYALNSGVISTDPVIIMGIGFSILPMASGPWNKYRNSLMAARSKKEKIEQVLGVYGFNYSFDIVFGDNIHGTQEVEASLTLNT